jgi:hypothetical protein
MDWTRLRAAVIRAFYTVILPLVGALVTYLLGDNVLESIGVTNEVLALIIGGILYGLKKYVWPDTVL